MSKKNSAGEQALSRVQLYQRVFNTQQGQSLLKDLIEAHNLLRTNYKGNVNDLLVLEGERNVVLRILQILKTDPQQLLERIAQYEASNS